MTAAEKLEKIYNIRIQIREAIRAKQVPIRNDTPFEDYQDFIFEIGDEGGTGSENFFYHIEDVLENSFILVQGGTYLPTEEDYYFNLHVNDMAISDATMYHPTRILIEHPTLPTTNFSIRRVDYIDRLHGNFYSHEFMFLDPLDRVVATQSLIRADAEAFFDKAIPDRVLTDWSDVLAIRLISVNTKVFLESVFDLLVQCEYGDSCSIVMNWQDNLNMEVT